MPARGIRFCGPEFKDDAYFLRSAEAEAERLMTVLNCDRTTRILDVGCGQGRLPIGILRRMGEVPYTGLDVDRKSIDWCKRYIEREHPSFRFRHLDVANERYYREGGKLGEGFKFDLTDGSVDIIYLYSVFSHMREEDMRVYLTEFKRMLADSGRVFFTTFVEEDVPPVSINPEGYRFPRCSGPLHVVRYEKGHLFSVLDTLGFHVDAFNHRAEANGQSAIYLSMRHAGLKALS